MKSTLVLYSLCLCLAAVSVVQGATWVVAKDGSGDYTRIQDAIDDAGYNDTIFVKASAPSIYVENLTLKSNIRILGEGESVWLHGAGGDHVVKAINVTNTQLDGMTIYHSGARDYSGVYISGGSPIISNNRIQQHKDGITIVGQSSAIIRNNSLRMLGNTENGFLDYGIICLHSSPLITNNLVQTSECGIYIGWEDSAGTRVINNTVVNNSADGIWCYRASATVKNNICVNNTFGIAASHNALPNVSYNNCWNNADNYNSQSGGIAEPGPGGLEEDPLFVGGAYFLDDDPVASPCIDAGDPDAIYNDIDGSRNDMGWHGGPDGRKQPLLGSIMSGFVFTTIGKIPVSELTSGGLANVSAQVASDLNIHQYQNAPFGGNLWLHGSFGPEDDHVRYYQILIARWTGKIKPLKTEAVPLTDSLTKIQYVIQSDGTVRSQPYTCGPMTLGGTPGMYYRTHFGYWAHPDLNLIWHTGSWPDGKYTLYYNAYDLSYDPVALPANSQDNITVIVNNATPDAEIHMVQNSDNSIITECGIIDIDQPDEDLRFVTTAYHPQGYLLRYTLQALYGKNKDAGDIANEAYSGTGSFHGIQNTTLYSQPRIPTYLDPWRTCAYQFRLDVWARTTDGFNYIRHRQFNDHYYINNACSWCGGADLNRNGIVGMDDLARVASHWLENGCQAACE